jgi:carbonic anhydrase
VLGQLKIKAVKAKKLYLICPDCAIEPVLSAEFGEEAFFLTALGGVFHFSEFDFAQSLNELLNREVLAEIVIVDDQHCTFIENTICKEQNYHTKAEQALARLYGNNAERFAPLDTPRQRALLARLNVYRQAYELLDVPFIGGKIDDGLVLISGMVYDRHSGRFEPVTL